ncbi:SAM-dependent methyltransferase [Candidatus Hodgkinia cicadicola]
MEFVLGCERLPLSVLRLFECCVKDLESFASLRLFTIFKKFANFAPVAACFGALLVAVRLSKLKQYTPFLRFSSLCVKRAFKCYGVTEALCLWLNYRPKYTVCGAGCLVRAISFKKSSFLKGLGFRLLSSVCAKGSRVLAYFCYAAAAGALLADFVCDNYGLTAERARAKAFLIKPSACLLSSGDCGLYSVSSLVWQLVSVIACCKVVAVPAVSSFQYLNALLGSPLSYNCCVVSFSNIFDWTGLKRFIRSCATCGKVCIIYNPKSHYRRRLLTYIVNCVVATSVYSFVSVGSQLNTRFEYVNSMCAHGVRLTIVSMLTIVFVCTSLLHFIKSNNALNCSS